MRVAPGAPWRWEGWFESPELATMFYNTIEIDYPEAEALWMEPESVFNSLTKKKDEFDD